MEDYLDLDESSEQYNIALLTPTKEETTMLWTKHYEKYVSRSKFWKPRLDIAKKCFEFEGRNILTPSQRRKYISEDKWPIEPQVMRPIINSLAQMIDRAVPGSDITYEDETPPETAADPDVVKTVISFIKHKLNLIDKRKRVLHKGLVGGFPICLWAERQRSQTAISGELPIKIEQRPWDSTLPSEYYSSETGEDIKDVIFLKDVTKEELYKTFPDRVDMHKRHIEMLGEDIGYIERFKNTGNSDTSNDRSNLIYGQITESKFNSIYGRYFAIESIFPIRKKHKVLMNTEDGGFVVVPPDWTYDHKVEFEKLHPEYDLEQEIDVNVLWSVIITSDGFVWENREHWYQVDGKLPCAWYIPDTVDNQPTGVGEDLLPYVLLKTASKIEGLSQVRKGTGSVTAFEEGTIKNAQNIRKELSSEEGIIISKKGTSPREAMQRYKRSPNTTFIDYEKHIDSEIESVHKVNESSMGASVNRQSAAAKELQENLALAPQSRYVDNYYAFTLQLENLLCDVIPMVIPKSFIVQIKDEYGQKNEPLEVNKVDFKYGADEATIISNDLTSTRYRAIAISGDDSKASRENQMRQFMDLLAAVGNQLFKLDPIFLGQTFSKFPNRFAREASKFLIEYGERQQQQGAALRQEEIAIDRERESRLEKTNMEKLRRPKLAFKISPEDIKNAPESAKLMFDWMNMYDQEEQQKNELAEQQNKQNQQQQQMTAV